MKKSIDMMNVKTCERCGGIYETFLEINYCPICHKLMEEKLDASKKFLRMNPDASIEEVAISVDLGRKQIIRWMRESRLFF